MRGLRYIFVLLVAFGAVSMFAPAGALADNCNQSAGDQQYVDPLQNCNPAPSSSGTHTTSTPSSSTAAPGAPVPSTPVASTASTTASTTPTATHSSDPSSGKTLPYTGLNLPAALLVAVGLVGGGAVLRRLTGAPRSS